MIQLKELYLQGFCSIGGELKLSLDTSDITVLRGHTGSGKSQTFNGLVWVLYGKNVKAGKNVKNRKVVNNVNTWKKYQPKDYKGTIGHVFFETSGHVHKVTRCQSYKGEVNGAKGGDRLIYEVDGIIVDDKKKGDIQSLIEADLGMSYSLFMNSVMFGQGLTRLIQESGADKKSLFEEIFEVGYLSEAREISKRRLQVSKDKYNELYSKYKSLEHEYVYAKDTYLQLKGKEDSFELDRQKKLKELEEQKNLSTMGVSWNTFKGIVKEQKEIEDKIQQENKKLQEFRIKMKEATKASNMSLSDLIDEIIELIRKDKKKALERLLTLRKSILGLEVYSKKISRSQSRLADLRDKVYTLKRKVSEQEHKAQEVERLERAITEVKYSKLTLSSFKYKSKYKKLAKELTSLKTLLDSSHRKIEDYQWLVDDPLGNNGIKAFLVESSMDLLNNVLESYTEELGFQIQFTVDLKSARKDFETFIFKDGIEVQYEELSGGQRQMCNLAMALAMNQVLYQAKGVNLALLDEVFEGLDRDCIDQVVGLIQKVYQGKTLFLITHQDSLPIPDSKTIKVTYKNGLSYYN